MDNALRVQLASLLILGYVAVNYFSAKRRKTNSHRIFMAMAVLSIINVTIDYHYTLLCLKTHMPSELLFRGYILTLCVLAFMIHIYIVRVITDSNGSFVTKINLWHFLGLFAYIIPFAPIRFEVINGWDHARGWGVLICYVYVLGFVLFDLILVGKNLEALSLETRMATVIALLSLGGSIIVQAAIWRNLITSIGIGFMVISMYIILENPDQLLIERLEFEKDRANAANESKTAFVAHVSHEIRTPINAILGMNEMILRESKEDFSRQYAQDISNAAYALYGIINDVLDVSKMESGKMEIYPVEYNLDKMLYEVISVNQNRLDTKQLDFITDVNPALPNLLYGDDVRIKQVLSNLLSNAIKYTHEGFVRIMVDGEFKQDMIELTFSVKDTGIGIKEEDISKLFVAFERIEESRNRSIEGTGLGMNITHNLLKQMGSHLDITSVYGEGSIFSFTLVQRIVNTKPIGDFRSYVKEQVKPNVTSLVAPTARILVVDDNSINRKVFISLLAKTKIKIDEAEDGLECLVKIKKAHYDVIFLDHLMPGMDGIETFKKIKESGEHLNIQTPIIMLTANALDAKDDLYRKSGFDAYLSKPVFINELEKLLKAYIPSYKIEDKENAQGKATGDNADWRYDLPTIRGIDWKRAVELLPTKEILAAAIEEFRSSIPAEAEALDKAFADIDSEGGLELMEIKAHALKSSSATIGAEVLSDGAREIELAAKEGKVELIKEKYPYMINYYRSFEKRLEAFRADDGRLKDINYPQVMSLFEIIKLEMNDLNRENAFEALDEIENYEFSDYLHAKIEKLKVAIKNFESENVNDLVDEINSELKSSMNA